MMLFPDAGGIAKPSVPLMACRNSRATRGAALHASQHPPQVIADAPAQDKLKKGGLPQDNNRSSIGPVEGTAPASSFSCSASRQERRLKDEVPACPRPGRRLPRGAFRKTACLGKRSYLPGNAPLPAKSRTATEGPFGELIRASGPMAKVNPFRFSTKFHDDETDLSYYDYRYYNASTGRWLSHDPLEESDSYNLYAFLQNEATLYLDLLGLQMFPPIPVSPPRPPIVIPIPLPPQVPPMPLPRPLSLPKPNPQPNPTPLPPVQPPTQSGCVIYYHYTRTPVFRTLWEGSWVTDVSGLDGPGASAGLGIPWPKYEYSDRDYSPCDIEPGKPLKVPPNKYGSGGLRLWILKRSLPVIGPRLVVTST